MSFTKVEKRSLNTPKKVSIKSYFNPNLENMGLEQYGLVVHDGVYHTEQLCCIENNGIKRYVTGLNEFAPDVKKLPEKERDAKILDIRKTVAALEADLAANILDTEDPEFWNKVKLLRPDNDEFWGKIELRAGNDILYLDPQSNPYDLIKLKAIEAGGFSIVAKSLEDANNMSKPPKFYLDRYEETVSTRNTSRKLRNKALAELQKLYDKNSVKLMYVTKVVDPGSPQYTKTTPNDVLYEVLDDYVNGNSFQKDQEKAAEHFLSVVKLSMEDLKLRALVKDATYYKEIAPKSDGFLYHLATSTMIGRNPEDAVEYLKNPTNDSILKELLDVIELYWNK